MAQIQIYIENDHGQGKTDCVLKQRSGLYGQRLVKEIIKWCK
jgi:hypothetical protein